MHNSLDTITPLRIENEAIRNNKNFKGVFINPIFRKGDPTFNISSKVTKKIAIQSVQMTIKSTIHRLNTCFRLLDT